MTIDANLRRVIDEAIVGPARAVLLFGSHARGDADHESDVDVLQVVDAPRRSYSAHKVNFSVYSREHLIALARSGSLFLRHVIEEARSVHDPEDVLGLLRRTYQPSVSHDHLRAEVLAATSLLDVDEGAFDLLRVKYAEAAKHLARSLVYADLADRDELTFRWQDALERVGANTLLALPRAADQWGYEHLLVVRQWLAHRLGSLCTNESGSLEALIVNAQYRSALTVVLGLRLLGLSDSSPYEHIALAAALVH